MLWEPIRCRKKMIEEARERPRRRGPCQAPDWPRMLGPPCRGSEYPEPKKSLKIIALLSDELGGQRKRASARTVADLKSDLHKSYFVNQRSQPYVFKDDWGDGDFEICMKLGITYSDGFSAWFLIDPWELCPTCWNGLTVHALDDQNKIPSQTKICSRCVDTVREMRAMVLEYRAQESSHPPPTQEGSDGTADPVWIAIPTHRIEESVKWLEIMTGSSNYTLSSSLMVHEICQPCRSLLVLRLLSGFIQVDISDFCRRCQSEVRLSPTRRPGDLRPDIIPLPGQIEPQPTIAKPTKAVVSSGTDRSVHKGNHMVTSAEFRKRADTGMPELGSTSQPNSTRSRSSKGQIRVAQPAVTEDVSYDQVEDVVRSADSLRLRAVFLELCQLSPALRKSTLMLLQPGNVSAPQQGHLHIPPNNLPSKSQTTQPMPNKMARSSGFESQADAHIKCEVDYGSESEDGRSGPSSLVQQKATMPSPRQHSRISRSRAYSTETETGEERRTRKHKMVEADEDGVPVYRKRRKLPWR
ncbi:MAG: hypothetical protein M1822_001314 [Bathelium mastoideum]|nr:MAG: hypothetical protein M1822_001314 [Bathelium mastoideum]